MSFLIRPAGVVDAAEVLSLWADAEAEPTHTDNVASITALISHDPAALIVAENEGRIVGSIIAGWDGWRGSVYRLAVAPDYRRRGLGRHLLDAAENRLATIGARRLQATVVETDQRADGFWRASGWEQQADRLRFVKG
jgi:ribosomal protein S18 acetylase RimI-like enzyme